MSDYQTSESLGLITATDVEHKGVQPQTLTPVARVQVRYVQMGKGHLKIYTRTVNGVPVTEAFTLQSLAECMGMAPGTMEGRYARGRLFNWKIDIPTGQSRPVRGFPLALLEQVMTVLTTRGARVEGSGTNEERLAVGDGAQARYPLEYEAHGGVKYITIPALARRYGVSTTTIRNKLSKAGLLGKGVNLNSPAQGGRPRRGFPAQLLDQLVDAIENGAQFLNECQAVYNRVQNPGLHQRPPVDAQPIQLQLPAGNLQAPPPDPGLDAMVAEIEAMMGQAKPAAPNPETTQSLQPWVERFRQAGDAIWDQDKVVSDMKRAGLSDGQVAEVIELAASALAGQERSEGEPA